MRLVSLTNYYGETIYINPAAVASITPINSDGHARVSLMDTDDAHIVRGSPEEVAEAVNTALEEVRR
jgi:hypothetical protein